MFFYCHFTEFQRGFMMGLLLNIALLVCIVEITYVSAQGSNCAVKDCPCNSKIINLNKPSDLSRNDLTVCCPSTVGEPCSEYFDAGDATETDNAFCNCIYTRVYGECLRGADECHGKPAGPSVNDMPLCCENTNERAFVEYIASNDTYHCRCKPASNCLGGGNCTCNTKTINTNPPGLAVKNQQVCCPPIDGTQCSTYLRVGDAYNASIPAFCDCDFARIKGSCLRGNQCDGKVTGADLNGMPICCVDEDHYISSAERIPNTRDFSCACSPLVPSSSNWIGNCLRGNSCYDKTVLGLFNDAPVCCPDPTQTMTNGIQNFGSAFFCNCA